MCDLYMLHEGKVGSITHTVDMNGSIRNQYDYDTFGRRTQITTANTGSHQHFGYTGEMQETESGLLYLRARYYDPTIGRFISPDPYLGRLAAPVTQNRYIYVHNNPLLYSDPRGLDVRVSMSCLQGQILISYSFCLGSANDDYGNRVIFTEDGLGRGLGLDASEAFLKGELVGDFDVFDLQNASIAVSVNGGMVIGYQRTEVMNEDFRLTFEGLNIGARFPGLPVSADVSVFEPNFIVSHDTGNRGGFNLDFSSSSVSGIRDDGFTCGIY